MPAARIFKPDNRLEMILGSNIDPTKQMWAKRAEQRLDAMRDGNKAYVRERLKQIEVMIAGSQSKLLVEAGPLAAAALQICEVAAAAGLASVGEAARALYILVSALNQETWHGEAVELHCQALFLIATSLSPEETTTVLTRLKTVREHIGLPD